MPRKNCRNRKIKNADPKNAGTMSGLNVFNQPMWLNTM